MQGPRRWSQQGRVRAEAAGTPTPPRSTAITRPPRRATAQPPATPRPPPQSQSVAPRPAGPASAAQPSASALEDAQSGPPPALCHPVTLCGARCWHYHRRWSRELQAGELLRYRCRRKSSCSGQPTQTHRKPSFEDRSGAPAAAVRTQRGLRWRRCRRMPSGQPPSNNIDDLESL